MAVVLLRLLLISTLMLVIIYQAFPGLPWAELSAVGHSYTGILAILYAGTLIGVIDAAALQ
jgi:hypothetical protein